MAAPRLFSLSRTLLTKQTLTSSYLSRHFSTKSSLLRLRSAASTASFLFPSPQSQSTFLRYFSTQKAQNSLSDNKPNWSNRPPKETILLDGCDFEHWLVVVDNPPENATRDEIIDSYIETLAEVIGSKEEARMKIYSVSTRHYFAFGALVSEELSLKLKELPNVRWVLPDSYLDVKHKDYGGEPFLNGQAVPYEPKYHEEWIRNNAKAQERNRRNDRPRNADRSRNFDRRQQTRNPNPNLPPSPPPPNMAGPGGPSNHPPGGPPPNNPRYPPNNPGFVPNNAGYQPNMPQSQNNPGYPPSNNPNDPRIGGGPQFNYSGQGNPSYVGHNHQGGGMPHQNAPPMGNLNYAPHNSNVGGGYQPQDVPGRDVPNY